MNHCPPPSSNIYGGPWMNIWPPAVLQPWGPRFVWANVYEEEEGTLPGSNEAVHRNSQTIFHSRLAALFLQDTLIHSTLVS